MTFPIPKDLRQEIKFIAHLTEAYLLDHWIREHPFHFTKAYPDRQVNNIYFDSYNFNSYADNLSGKSSRSKVRYRWYGESVVPTAGTLEIKRKRNAFNWKLSHPIEDPCFNKEDPWKAFRQILLSQLPKEGQAWLQTHAQPVLINRYRRAYYATAKNDIRITVDTDLTVYDQGRSPLPNWARKVNLPQMVVLEIKFQPSMRSKASRLTSNIPVRLSRLSKYTVGVLNCYDL